MIKKTLATPLVTVLIFTCSSFPVFSQLSMGGQPVSFNSRHGDIIPEISLPAPDLDIIRSEDMEDEKQALPRRVAVAVSAGINMNDHGRWQKLPDGSSLWILKVSIEGALAVSLCFEDFQMTQGAKLFIYDEERRVILGAFTAANNKPGRLFSTGLIPGGDAILELNIDAGTTEMPSLSLSELSYLYRDLPDFIGDRGPSDPCEVNINCPEGMEWQKQKRGITRIYVKNVNSFFWCTGSLVNNTRKDLASFLLTADHCAPDVSPGDLSQWIFYFNFEAAGCENPPNNPPANSSLGGAARLANASTDGSDFLLVLLDDEVPLSYGPFFNGWNTENFASPRGVTIHHPNGDIKKISTYTQPLASSQWSSTPGTHWEVFWSPTVTNWGVTEGGSSGAPLFDNYGKIIGTLTGGLAACEPNGNGSGTGPDKPDYYGKFSFSWDKNGLGPESQLKPWLDPDNTGVTSLAGMNSVLTAAFEADERIILTGSSITYANLSSGLPVAWEWTFEGGTPPAFSGQEPPAVSYASEGLYDVELVVTDGLNFDTLVYHDYIQVVGKVFPNPTSSYVNVFINEDLPSLVRVGIYDIAGHKLLEAEIPDQNSRLVSVDLSAFSAGIYVVRIQVKQRFIFAKVFKI